jgi:hypothetical protein
MGRMFRKRRLRASSLLTSRGSSVHSGCLLLALTVILFGCTGRPYFCQYVVYPPEKKFHEGGWMYSAAVCETLVRRGLFTYQEGVAFSIVVQDSSGSAIAERRIFFVDVEEIDTKSYWLDARSLRVEVSERSSGQEVDGDSVPIAEINLSLSAP